MFIGGCAGSTGGGMKVIRHILFYKVLRLEIEKAHRPRVIRNLRISGSAVDDPDLGHRIVVYFSMILAIFVVSWLLLIALEPDSTWQHGPQAEDSTLDEKLLDSASAVAATLNNIGPGVGVVGATKNYANFSQGGKLLFVWLMMLGRVEVFSVLVLIFPAFWRRV
jgi:trk system potassium uptake protein TrkH